MALQVNTSYDDQSMLITVSGDVDLYTSPELRTAIMGALPNVEARVAVELSGVDYMDSSGVATLVEGLKSAREHGKEFQLVAPSLAVMKVLKLARLDTVFEVSPAT